MPVFQLFTIMNVRTSHLMVQRHQKYMQVPVIEMQPKNACALVDDSFGSAQALRGAWVTVRQLYEIASQLPILLSLSPTGYTGSAIEKE